MTALIAHRALVRLSCCVVEDGRHYEYMEFEEWLLSDRRCGIAIACQVAQKFPGCTIKGIEWR